MKITFTAQIYDNKTRATKDNAIMTRITLEQSDLALEVVNAVNELQYSDNNKSREIKVVLSDE